MRIGYGRVSSKDQHLDVQQARLAACCDEVRLEKRSGTTMTRPVLQGILGFLSAGDTLVVCRLDRLARSTMDLYQIAAHITQAGASLEILDQAVDTETPAGRALFGVLGIMAEFETALRKERQAEGIRAAQAHGVHFGRTRQLTPVETAALHQRRAHGERVVDLARHYGLSRNSVYRYLAEARASSAEAAD